MIIVIEWKTSKINNRTVPIKVYRVDFFLKNNHTEDITHWHEHMKFYLQVEKIVHE